MNDMANIGSLTVSLAARTDKFTKGLASARASLNRFASFAGKLAIGAAIGAAAASMAALGLATRNAFRDMDAMGKQADRLGILTESLAALRRAGQRAGATTEQMDNALERMNRSVGQAAQGLATPTRAFQMLGLSTEELLAMPTERRLGAIADGLKSIENPAMRAAAAADIFGQRSRNVINLLMQGSGALDDARKKADQLGLTFNRVDARKIEMANDAWDEMGTAVQGIGNQIALYMAPAIEWVANKTTDWIVSLNKIGGIKPILETVADAAFGLIGGIVDSTNALWQTIKTGVMGLQAFSATVVTFIARQVMTLIQTALSGISTILEALGKIPGPIGDGARAGMGAIDALNKHVIDGLESNLRDSEAIARELQSNMLEQGAKMEDAWSGFFAGRTAEKLRNGWDSIMSSAETRAAESVTKMADGFGDLGIEAEKAVNRATQRAGTLEAGADISIAAMSMSGANTVDRDQLTEQKQQTKIQQQMLSALRGPQIAVVGA